MDFAAIFVSFCHLLEFQDLAVYHVFVCGVGVVLLPCFFGPCCHFVLILVSLPTKQRSSLSVKVAGIKLVISFSFI